MTALHAAPHCTPRLPRAAALTTWYVIAIVGGVGAALSIPFGMGATLTCIDSGRALCHPAFGWLLVLGSLPATAGALGLAHLGVVRHGTVSGYRATAAAWVLWAGFCALWWAIVLTLTS